MNAVLHGLREYLIQQSGQVALLILIVVGLSWLLRHRSAHVRYLLWLVVLAKCLVPPVMNVPLAVLPAEPVVVTEPVETFSEPMSTPVVPLDVNPVVTVTQPTMFELLQRHGLVVLWMGGAVAFGLGMMLRAGCFHRRLLRDRVPAPASLVQELADLQVRFGGQGSITAWLTPQTSQPFVWGRWRGQIYLPLNFLEQTNSSQRQSILAHELAHIQRCDPLINFIQIMVQALFWFHPLVWWANLQIRREREKCCDEMAIAVLGADVKDYCNTIVDVLVQQCPRRLPLGSVAIAGPVRNIEERIKTLMNPNKRFSKKAGSLSVLSIVLFALMVTPVSFGITKQNVIESTHMDPIKPAVSQTKSAENLSELGRVLLRYINDQDNPLMDLEQLKGWGDDEIVHWARRNIILLGEPTDQGVIAYDRILLSQEEGTNVLFQDGHVEYANLDQVGLLGWIDFKISMATDIMMVSKNNDVVAQFLQAKGLLAEMGSKAVPREQLLQLIDDTKGAWIIVSPVIRHINGVWGLFEISAETEGMPTGLTAKEFRSQESPYRPMKSNMSSLCVNVLPLARTDSDLVKIGVDAKFDFVGQGDSMTQRHLTSTIMMQSKQTHILNLGDMEGLQYYLMITPYLYLPENLKSKANPTS